MELLELLLELGDLGLGDCVLAALARLPTPYRRAVWTRGKLWGRRLGPGAEHVERRVAVF